MLRVLSSIQPGLYKNAIIHNTGVAIIMFGAIMCLDLVYPCKKIVYILMFIPILYVFFLNLPYVGWHIFLDLNNPTAGAGVQILYFLKKSTVFVAGAYLLMPMVIFIFYLVKTKIFIKKRHALSCMSCILLIYIVIYLLFINGAFQPTMFYNLDLMSFPKSQLGMFGERISITVSLLCIFGVNTVIILYFSPFKKYGNRKWFVKRSEMINKNIYMLLHTYKNNFLCIEKLVSLGEEAEKSENRNEAIKIFEKIKRESGDSVKNISRTLRQQRRQSACKK